MNIIVQCIVPFHTAVGGKYVRDDFVWCFLGLFQENRLSRENKVGEANSWPASDLQEQ